MSGLPVPFNPCRPSLDLDMRQKANDYRAWLDLALERYELEGRAHVDPVAMLDPEENRFANDLRRLGSRTAPQERGGVWLGGNDGLERIDFARTELVARVLYAYLQQAQQLGIDLTALWHSEKPEWVREYIRDAETWLRQPPAYRFERIESWRAERLYGQWEDALGRLPAGADCLEIGCGSGFFTRNVLERHPALHWQATDLPRPMPIDGTPLDRNAQPWFRECGVRQPLPYADESQDVVFVNNVLHHVAPEVIDAFLGEMRRVLKPGGKLYVTEEYAPDFSSSNLSHVEERCVTFKAKHFSEFMDNIFWPEDVGNQRTPDAWQQMLGTAGFRMMYNPRVVGTFGTPGLPVMEACMCFEKIPS